MHLHNWQADRALPLSTLFKMENCAAVTSSDATSSHPRNSWSTPATMATRTCATSGARSVCIAEFFSSSRSSAVTSALMGEDIRCRGNNCQGSTWSALDDTVSRNAPLVQGAGRGHFRCMKWIGSSRPSRYSAAGLVMVWIAGSVSLADTDSAGEYGPKPAIPAPTKSIIPTLNVAKARGWQEGMAPRASKGTAVAPFATGLQHPRWLYVLPNG